jgi:nucleoside-diphosphate-sugar epimerase
MLSEVTPGAIEDVEQLEALLSRPTESLISTMRRLRGDILLLGAGGKIGPSIARMAKRASDAAEVSRRVIAVSRFSNRMITAQLHACGVETIEADLLDSRQLQRLPDAENIIYLAGYKFGAVKAPSFMWALNSYLPGRVMEQYRDSRVVVFSTGNVYGKTLLTRGGAEEDQSPRPTDEYSMSCLGRERIAEHFSGKFGTSTTLLRLNYAVELRYGVLVDIAEMVLDEEPVDVTMGHVNVIWQGDANAIALCALERASSPPFVLNVTGPELLSVRSVAELFGRIMNKPVTITGTESLDCYLANSSLSHELFGYPRIPVRQLIRWIADWIGRGETTHKKPTSFQVRDGQY